MSEETPTPASVRITMTLSDGTVLDDATALMSDDALGFTIEAMSVMRNWSEDTGVSKARWFTWELRKYAERQVELYAHRLAAAAAQAQADAIKGTVVVPS